MGEDALQRIDIGGDEGEGIDRARVIGISAV